MNDVKRLEERLEELEIKIAFQEDLLTSLNDVMIKQDKEIQDLWTANRLLKESIKDNQNGQEPQTEPPPPHY